MKRFFLTLLCLALALTLIACDTPSPTPTPQPTPTPDIQESDGEQQTAFEALFSKENHISLKLDISDTELAKLQADYDRYSSFGSKSPIYRMADLYVTITTPSGKALEWCLKQVGVRMKGNTSRETFYSNEEGMYSLIHFKISFGETFDDPVYYGADALVWDHESAKLAREKRTFATLEKMDLRWNRNDDPTYIREGYAYDLYRALGVLAPHTHLASVDIGGDHAGVFTIYEPIDKGFLKRNLPASAIGGDLYKLGWTYEGATFSKFTSYGVEDEDEGKFYIYDLKTNKTTSTHKSLKTLIETINGGALSKEKFEGVVDMEQFLTFCAVSYIIGNPDDLRNNYNNCYLYFRADTGKALFIPYDLDRGLGVNTWNPYGNGMTTDSPFALYNVVGKQKNPLFTKTITDGGLYLQEYKAALQMVMKSSLLSNATFSSAFTKAKSLYAKDTTPSKTYYNAEHYSFAFDINKTASPSDSANMSFSDYMKAKLATLTAALEGEDLGEDIKPSLKVEMFIRADFINWDLSAAYQMHEDENGISTLTIKEYAEFRFKVYDNISQRWYGTECVSKECDVAYESDGHTNIVLPAGTYLVSFDKYTNTIYLEVEN